MADGPEVVLYTDGACSGNPGPGGWAFVLRHVASGKELERSGGEADTTNNIAVAQGTIAERQLTVLNQQLAVQKDMLTELKGLRSDMSGLTGRQVAAATSQPVSPADSRSPEITHGAGIIDVKRKRA